MTLYKPLYSVLPQLLWNSLANHAWCMMSYTYVHAVRGTYHMKFKLSNEQMDQIKKRGGHQGRHLVLLKYQAMLENML